MRVALSRAYLACECRVRQFNGTAIFSMVRHSRVLAANVVPSVLAVVSR